MSALVLSPAVRWLPWLSWLPEMILRAVPKKKVSHSRKSMRSAHKHLREKTNISTCRSCGLPKRMHHICPNCYGDITRRFKESLGLKQRQDAEPALG